MHVCVYEKVHFRVLENVHVTVHAKGHNSVHEKVCAWKRACKSGCESVL